MIGFAILGGVVLTFIGLAALWWTHRQEGRAEVTFTTLHGVRIVAAGMVDHPVPDRLTVEGAYQAAIDFWSARWPDQADRIAKRFRTGRLKFVNAPIAEGAGHNRATTQGASTLLWWERGRDAAHLFSLIRHEAGHTCLFAVEWRGDHHEAFASFGFD